MFEHLGKSETSMKNMEMIKSFKNDDKNLVNLI